VTADALDKSRQSLVISTVRKVHGEYRTEGWRIQQQRR
jgi:hypothetical protein